MWVLEYMTKWPIEQSWNRREDKYKCTWCWTEIYDSWIGFYPLHHNIDIWEELLKTCGCFILIKKELWK